MKRDQLISKVKKYPTSPGIYQMKDHKGKIIYIGKAKNLRKRVISYFQKKDHDDKTKLLVAYIYKIDYIVTDTEIEALLLEAELIRKHKPKYNINLKDSVRYAYLMITREEYPRIITVRDKTKKGTYYGPFTDAFTRETLAEMAKNMFRIRTCAPKLPQKVCLQYHIKRCDAPCINNISKKDYGKNIQRAKLLLGGKVGELKKDLKQLMKVHSEKLEYEKAKLIRDQIVALERLGEGQKIKLRRSFNQDIIDYIKVGDDVHIQLFKIERGIIQDKKEFQFAYMRNILDKFVQLYYSVNPIPEEIVLPKEMKEHLLIHEYLVEKKKRVDDKPRVKITVPKSGIKKELLDLVRKNLLEMAKEENKALVEIKEKLNLASVPRVIECFDISNLKNVGIVGSMVQWRGNNFDKNNYRRFRIRSTETQDDFASMKEVVYRRYSRLLQEDKQMPDLIVIDGGKGQLSAAFEMLEELHLNIPIIGLAKKLEEIYIVDESKPLKWSAKSDSSRLLQKIRNETHRFAVKYHRLVRERQAFSKK